MAKLTAAQLTLLNQEITTNPRGYPYLAGDDSSNADILNAVRDGSNPPATPLASGPGTAPAGNADGHINVPRTDIKPAEVLQATAIADMLAAPSVPQQLWFSGLMNGPTFALVDANGVDTQIKASLTAMITGNGSRTRLNAIANRFGSRAEELFGSGRQIIPNDIAVAQGRASY